LILDGGTFVKILLPADGNNIVTIFDFNQILSPWKEFEAEYIVKHLIVLEDFQCKIGLFSFLERGWPNKDKLLATESAQQAELDKLKKEGQKVYLEIFHAYGNGPWISKGEEILQNVNSLELPWALMSPFFSTNETAILDSTLKVGARIVSKAQGIGGLKGNDYIKLFGAWRSSTTREKKKDDGIEALLAEIDTLKLALSGAKLTNVPANTLLGRNATSGAVETIPQSTFAKPEDINTAIFNLIGSAPGALDTLDELAAALADDANFANTILNLLGTKAPLVSPITITVTGALNIAANTWFSVGLVNGIGAAGIVTLYNITVMIQYGDGSNNTYGHWQYGGGGVISSIQWKAGGTQNATTFKMESHNSNDFNCSARFNLSNVNRSIQVMFDVPIVTQAPTTLKVVLKPAI
jgi:hypothetical protein